MKTRRFALLVSILVMGAVIGSAGQPARGNKNGNHEKNNRKEVKSDERREVRGMHAVEGNSYDRAIVRKGMDVRKNAVIREPGNYKSKGNQGKVKAKDTYRKEHYVDRHYAKAGHSYAYSSYYRSNHIPVYFHGNKHYRYHPRFGHTVRKFAYDPVRFWADREPYYFSDGFFYRHHPGIGYIWVEDPYDIWFTELPREAVRVRIGGNLYFRMGNAFFAAGPFGFRLATLPDHYYDRGPSFAVDIRF